MAVAWENLTTEGVQFTYDALPALGGGFSLAAPQSPVTEALVPRSAGDAAPDTLARTDAVPLVTTYRACSCTPLHCSAATVCCEPLLCCLAVHEPAHIRLADPQHC